MNRFTLNTVQKWKVVMYASMLMVFLMNFTLCFNNAYLYNYIVALPPSVEKRYFMFLVIYLVYMFFHLLILIGATKSRSRLLYMVPIYWSLQIYWLIAHYLTDYFPKLPIIDLYKEFNAWSYILGGVNNVYFTDTEKYAIILNSPYASYVIITRQDRILIYVSIVFIILSVVCIRKSKKSDKK